MRKKNNALRFTETVAVVVICSFLVLKATKVPGATKKTTDFDHADF